MDGGGGDEGVDAGAQGVAHSLPGGVDVGLGCARQAADHGHVAVRVHRVAHFLRDIADGAQVVGRGYREAGTPTMLK